MTDYDTEQVLTFFADNRAVRGKLESWTDELASKHVSVKGAMPIIQERMSDYLKEIYDAINRKATGRSASGQRRSAAQTKRKPKGGRR